MAVHVRSFTLTDREFILSLVPRFSEFDLPGWRQRNEIDHANRVSLQKALQQPEPGSAIFIADDEEEGLAGFIHLQTQTDYFGGEDIGYISDLAVAPSFEGRGVGRLLLVAAEQWAYEKGYCSLTLYVFAGNTRARQLYEKHGFSQEVVKYVKVVRQNE